MTAVIKGDKDMLNTEKLDLTAEWDKTYERDERTLHEKVTFMVLYYTLG